MAKTRSKPAQNPLPALYELAKTCPGLARTGQNGQNGQNGHFDPFGQVLTGPGQVWSPSSENSVRF